MYPCNPPRKTLHMKKNKLKSIARIISALLLAWISFPLAAQEPAKKASIDLSAFLDVYYGRDFNSDQGGERFPFLYNHNRNNTLAINLALVTARLQAGRIRANLGLQRGTYAEDNYSAEPEALRWIHEANLGYALNPEKTIWLDAGVLPSHIGFENAVSTKNLTLSRSIIAENSPYFETGFQLSWQQSERWYFALLYLNGWQQIQPIEGKNRPSFGTQAMFTPSEKLTLNWSTFIGTDQGIEAGTSLYFSNIYAEWKPSSKWHLIAGLDAGKRTEELDPDSNWWGMSLILQRKFTEQFASAIRYEYYHDPFQAIASSNVNEGIQTGGLSVNLDWNIMKSLIFRVEGRWLQAPSGFNLGQDSQDSSNFFLLGSLAWSLNSKGN